MCRRRHQHHFIVQGSLTAFRLGFSIALNMFYLSYLSCRSDFFIFNNSLEYSSLISQCFDIIVKLCSCHFRREMSHIFSLYYNFHIITINKSHGLIPFNLVQLISILYVVHFSVTSLFENFTGSPYKSRQLDRINYQLNCRINAFCLESRISLRR